ncbi:NfeD family protein [Calothrix sp. NIES-3974]|uniref:NfeD family protein n=1 Tax=Calothrix sp. NIES-3974 TaxID=2005462 RepID=UPI000B5FE089|nr:NfeD family protein [Calothrix sp. NIES-3974]BAZ06942.1 hypothetical protein NIES3974_36040 [Calothrix sp. NIES-3974]
MTTLSWVLLAGGFLLLELLLPVPFLAMIGISALFVALLVWMGLANTWLQIAVWIIVSGLLILSSRRFLVRKRGQIKLKGDVIAETLTEIPPGKTGRVLYEGNSWQARCDDEMMLIPAQERVYVVRREGTTLIVMPQSVLRSG